MTKKDKTFKEFVKGYKSKKLEATSCFYWYLLQYYNLDDVLIRYIKAGKSGYGEKSPEQRKDSVQASFFNKNSELFKNGKLSYNDVTPIEYLDWIEFPKKNTAQRYETLFHECLCHHYPFIVQEIPKGIHDFEGMNELYINDNNMFAFLKNYKNDFANYNVVAGLLANAVNKLKEIYIDGTLFATNTKDFYFQHEKDNLFYISVHKDDLPTYVTNTKCLPKTSDIKAGKVLWNNSEAFDIVSIKVNDKPVWLFKQCYTHNKVKDRYNIPIDFCKFPCNGKMMNIRDIVRDDLLIDETKNKHNIIEITSNEKDETGMTKEVSTSNDTGVVDSMVSMADEVVLSNDNVPYPEKKEGNRVRIDECTPIVWDTKIECIKAIINNPNIHREFVLSAMKHISKVPPLQNIFGKPGNDYEYFNKQFRQMLCFNPIGNMIQNVVPLNMDTFKFDSRDIAYVRVKAACSDDDDLVLLLFTPRTIAIRNKEIRTAHPEICKISASAYIIGMSGYMFDFLQLFGITSTYITYSFNSVNGTGNLTTNKPSVSIYTDGKYVRDENYATNISILDVLMPGSDGKSAQLTNGLGLITHDTLVLEPRNSNLWKARVSHNAYLIFSFAIHKSDSEVNFLDIRNRLIELSKLDIATIKVELMDAKYLRDILINNQNKDCWKFQQITKYIPDHDENLEVKKMSFWNTTDIPYKYTRFDEFYKHYLKLRKISKNVVPDSTKKKIDKPAPELKAPVKFDPENDIGVTDSQDPISENEPAPKKSTKKDIKQMTDNVIFDELWSRIGREENLSIVDVPESSVQRIMKDGSAEYRTREVMVPVRFLDTVETNPENEIEQVISESQYNMIVAALKAK